MTKTVTTNNEAEEHLLVNRSPAFDNMSSISEYSSERLLKEVGNFAEVSIQACLLTCDTDLLSYGDANELNRIIRNCRKNFTLNAKVKSKKTLARQNEQGCRFSRSSFDQEE